MGKKLELTGQKFGSLTVIKESDVRKRGMVQWECQCDCGNICLVPGSLLKNGNTVSCGCQARSVLIKYNIEASEKNKIQIGEKFGKLIVTEDLGFRKHVEGHNRRWYKCKCECGRDTEASGNQLKSGLKKSCGCLMSAGEFIISQLLEVNNIEYKQNYIEPLLYKETGKKLRFDFIIYNDDNSINRIIEFDGRQHYDGPDTEFWGRTLDTLADIKYRDQIKNDFCFRHNIPLLRIPYWHKNTITFTDLFNDKFIVKKERSS